MQDSNGSVKVKTGEPEPPGQLNSISKEEKPQTTTEQKSQTGESLETGIPGSGSTQIVGAKIAATGPDATILTVEKVGKVEVNATGSTSLTIDRAVVLYSQKEESTRLLLREVKTDKISSVFVAPEGYAAFLKILTSQEKTRREHIFILYGPDHSGKFACAVCLGMSLLERDEVQQDHLFTYWPSKADNRSLVDVFLGEELYDQVQGKESRPPSVFIIEDAFEKGISINDLASGEAGDIQRKLTERQSFLILTTDCTETQLAETPVPKISVSLSREQVKVVFSNHLDWFSRQAKVANKDFLQACRQSSPDLAGSFDYAYLIDDFFNRGSLQGEFNQMVSEALASGKDPVEQIELDEKGREPLLIEQVKILAGKVRASVKGPTHLWFSKLPENARLYAMLVVLFDGIAIQNIDSLYGKLVRKLRDDGVATLCDHRELGREDLLSIIRARVGEDDLVYFDNSACKSEISSQINNRHALLWSLVDILEELIENYKAPEFWELRRALGIAIGRLGIHRQTSLRDVLFNLAENKSAGVAVVVGYALDEICRLGSEYYPFVNALLDEWAESFDPDLTWATAASIWRVYDTLTKDAQSGKDFVPQAQAALQNTDKTLTHLAETFDDFPDESPGHIKAFNFAIKLVAEDQLQDHNYAYRLEFVRRKMGDRLFSYATANMGSVLFALSKMWISNAARVVDLVCKWLEAKRDSNLRIIGFQAARHLFEQTADEEQILLEDCHGPLLRLVLPLLEEDAETADSTLWVLVGWLDRLDPERQLETTRREFWKEKIQAALLQAINRFNPHKLEWIRTSLVRRWLSSSMPDTQRIGRALLARTYLIAGQAVLLPGQAGAGLALDASRRSRNGTWTEFSRGLAERLAARFDTYVFLQGRREEKGKEAVLLPGQPDLGSFLYHRYDLPCLALPLLEWLQANLPGEQLFFLVLAWEQALDLDDLDAMEMTMPVFLARFTPEEVDEGRVAPLLPYTVIKPAENTSEGFRKMVEDRIDQELAGYLAKQDAQKLGGLLAAISGFPIVELEETVAWLEQKSQETDLTVNPAIEGQPGYDSAVALALGIVWFSKVDLARCVDLLDAWMKESERTIRGCLGEACSRLLFNIYSHPTCPVARETAAPGLQHLCRLGSALLAASRDQTTLVIVLKAVRRWLDSPAWAPLLLNSSDPGGLQEQPAITLLADLVDAAGSSEQAFLQQELEGWRKEDDAPESVRQAALWMLIRLAVRQRKLLPDPGEECKYGIILLDVSQTGNRAMAETALQFVRELISRSFLHLSFETLVYRLGEALPAATWPQSLCPEDLISVEDCRHPLLATPILEIIPPGKAAFILCLANQEILDLEDWLDGWQNILLLHFCYGGRQPVYPASFVSIDFPMEPGSKFESAAAARTIIKKLFDVMK